MTKWLGITEGPPSHVVLELWALHASWNEVIVLHQLSEPYT
jgi:hypothetical protein